MANQAFSRSDDLMVGAGVLYFQRNDDPHGWHHLGNAEEFTINNNIETVEKNSSMNKKRELMARVVTSVQPQANITLNEYNPYNLALGLYGTEGVERQANTAIQNQQYVVNSVPGVITVVDGNGERYMDIRNVTVAPATSTSPSATFDTSNTSFTYDVTATTATYSTGGEIQVAIGTASPTSDQTVFVSVEPATATGVTDGAVIHVKVGLSGSVVSKTVPTGSGSSYTWTLNSSTTADGPAVAPVNGLQITVQLGSGDDFAGGSDPVSGATINVLAPVNTYEAGKDYILDPQELRAGIIKIKSGGRIQEGDTVLVTCTVPEREFVTVSGSDAGEIEGKLLFIGDPNIGGQYNIEGWKVKVTPDGDLTGLIGTDFGSYTLSISFLSDYENHPDYPYFKATLINRSSGDAAVNSDYDPEY